MGPEVACLAALGPVIVVRYLLLETPTRARWRHWTRIGLPYLALIVVLAGTRVVEPLHRLLGEAVAIRPFADGAVALPLLHPATWLVLVGAAVAVATGRPRSLPPAVVRAWSIGRRPVLTIMLFLAMAELIVAAGAAHQAAIGLRALLGEHGLEREVYARAWIMCAVPMAILFAAAGLLVALR